MRRLAAVLLVIFGAALPAHAATIVLDFETEPEAGDYQSFVLAGAVFEVENDCSCDDAYLRVGGGELRTLDYVLRIAFAEPAFAFELDFGGDQALQRDPGALAVLWVNGELVATVEANRDGLVNQTIGASGPISEARFILGGAADDDTSYAVGSVRWETVPEPAALGLGVLLAAATAVRPRSPGSSRSSPPSPALRLR